MQRYNLAMTNGKLPDVGDMFTLPSWIVQGKGKWSPANITKLVQSGTFGPWSRFVPSSQSDCSYKGQIYALPWRIDVRAFVYRNDLWPTAPKTLADFEATGKQVVAKNPGGKITYAAEMFGSPYHTLMLLAALWGTSVLTPDLQSSNLDNPKWVTALTWVQKMVHESLFDPGANTNPTFPGSAYFLKGNNAAQFGGQNGILAIAQGTAPQVIPNLRAALMPTVQAGQRPIGIAASAPLCIFQNTKDMASSVAWLKYLVSLPVAKAMAIAAGVGSSDSTVAPLLSKDPFMAVFPRQALNCGSMDLPSPAWAQIIAYPEGPLHQLTVNIFSLKDVTSSLADAHKAINAVLKSYKS
jgi:multiple sugar transport system substrate-binding protein